MNGFLLVDEFPAVPWKPANPTGPSQAAKPMSRNLLVEGEIWDRAPVPVASSAAFRWFPL
jgi:hypothetical protein